MTAPETDGPIITFAYQDAQKKLEPLLTGREHQGDIGRQSHAGFAVRL